MTEFLQWMTFVWHVAGYAWSAALICLVLALFFFGYLELFFATRPLGLVLIGIAVFLLLLLGGLLLGAIDCQAKVQLQSACLGCGGDGTRTRRGRSQPSAPDSTCYRPLMVMGRHCEVTAHFLPTHKPPARYLPRSARWTHCGVDA